MQIINNISFQSTVGIYKNRVNQQTTGISRTQYRRTKCISNYKLINFSIIFTVLFIN